VPSFESDATSRRLAPVTGCVRVLTCQSDGLSQARRTGGSDGGGEGVASSFDVRKLVWRPGSVVAPVAAGWPMANVGMRWVFYVGGGFALLGAVTFLGVFRHFHGSRTLTEW